MSKTIKYLIVLLVLFGVTLYGGSLLAHKGDDDKEDEEKDIPVATGPEDLEDLDDLRVVDVASNSTLRFVMDVEWGHVEDDDEERVRNATGTNFDGSITVPQGKVSLLRVKHFERHNDTADKITSLHDPVSWNSLIFGHRDEVRVLVSAPASSTVSVTTTQGSITKTAQEFFALRGKLVADAGSGREIVVKTKPFTHRHFFLKVLWGKVDREAEAGDATLNFAGSFAISGEGKLKLKKTLLFESAHRCEEILDKLDVEDFLDIEADLLCRLQQNRDRILEHSRSRIAWQSFIDGGVDGVLVRVNLGPTLTATDTLTLRFPELGFEKSFPILDLHQNRTTKETLTVATGTSGYGVILSVWEKHDRSLVKTKGRPDVFFVEDGEIRHVPSLDVFNARNLEWDDVEEVSEEELEGLVEGDPLVFPDGTLVKGSDPKIFVISSGKKRHLVSPQVFVSLGFNWGAIKNVSDADLARVLEGSSLTATSSVPEGTLVRIKDTPTVWVIEGGKKRPIPALEVFLSHKFDWQNVGVVDVARLQGFSEGAPLEFADGSLLAGPDGKVFLVDNAKKRWIRSALDFVKAGFDWEDIISIPAKDVAKLQEEDTLVGED